jgi:hypothetical protein
MIIFGVILGMAGAILMAHVGNSYATCQSLLGQLDQQMSPSASAECSGISVFHWVGLLGLIAGVALVLIGVVVWKLRQERCSRAREDTPGGI